VKGLRRAANLGRNLNNRCPLGGVLPGMFMHHPDSPLADLRCVTRSNLPSLHSSILLKIWSLRENRGGSPSRLSMTCTRRYPYLTRVWQISLMRFSSWA
jgi:hypothetical protein